MKLENKVAIVTGAAQGIGKAIALRMAEEGANIAIVDIKKDKAENVKDEIEAIGSNAEVIKTDISKEKEVKEMIGKVIGKFGKIDILVNNAGVLVRGKFLETSEKKWDKAMNINLKGAFLCAKEAAKVMLAKNTGGKIINITSIDGEVVYYHGDHAPYGVAKAGLIMLTKGMAVELAEENINVNAIAPGVVKTDIAGDSMEDKEHYREVVNDIPMKRMAKPDEITGAAVFLASSDSEYVTGTTLFVDGGWTIH